jgi:hypothetical protein
MADYSYTRNLLEYGYDVNTSYLSFEIKNQIDINKISCNGSECKISFDKDLTTEEKTLLDSLVELSRGILHYKEIREKKYKVDHYDAQKLTTDSYYDTDNGDGTYSGLAEKTTYTYQGAKLLNKVVVTYYYDGTQASSIKYTYFQNSNGELIEKQVEA